MFRNTTRRAVNISYIWIGVIVIVLLLGSAAILTF